MSANHLVVLRFSALGDVALTVPVLRTFSEAYPNTRITMVTRTRFSGLFSGIKNLRVYSVDFNDEYSGLNGIWKLARVIGRLKPDAVIDLHDNLRTKILRIILGFSATKFFVFKKGRTEKKLATGRSRVDHRKPLPHTTERYAEVFTAAGFPFIFKLAAPKRVPTNISLSDGGKISIGIAPFAAHATKRWSIKYFEQLVTQLSEMPGVNVYLFGGGTEETSILKEWENRFKNCTSIAGKYSIEEELEIIKKLRVMVCTDSSNMHLASISGVPVVSIWGGTHTLTGFGPLPVSENVVVEMPLTELPCRPCSVYGKSTCERRDFACLTGIQPARVVAEIKKLIQ